MLFTIYLRIHVLLEHSPKHRDEELDWYIAENNYGPTGSTLACNPAAN